MILGQTFTTDNGAWQIKVVRSSFPEHMSGWLINMKTGNRYVFSVVKDKVNYMRAYKPPTNLPRYIDEFILNLQGK